MTESNEEILGQLAKREEVNSESLTINEPVTGGRAEQQYVSIPIEINQKEWEKANTLVGEILAWLRENEVQPSGAPFFRYLVIGDTEEKFKIEVGVPIMSPIFGDDRVITGTIPAGKYATLVHNGHPDSIGNSFTALEEWAKKHDLKWDNQMEGKEEVWGGRFEFYLTDPAVEPNLDKWSTEIAYKIKE